MQRESDRFDDKSSLDGLWLFILELDHTLKADIQNSIQQGNNYKQKIIYPELSQCAKLFTKINVLFFIIVVNIDNLYQLVNQPNKYQDIYSKIKQVYLYDMILNGQDKLHSNRRSYYRLLSIEEKIKNHQDINFYIKLIKCTSQFQMLLKKYKYWTKNRTHKGIEELRANPERYSIFSNFFILNNQMVRSDLTKFILKVRKYILLPQSQISQNKQEFKKYVKAHYQQKYKANNNNSNSSKELDQFKIQFREYQTLNTSFTYPLSLQDSRKIIQFYSREGFYYKMANYSLRNEQSNYQTFELHQSIIKTFSDSLLIQDGKYYLIPKSTLYHGGKISKTDLQKVRPSDYIMISSFLSTSKDKKIAQHYRNQSRNNGYLMQITIKGGKYSSKYLGKYNHGFQEMNQENRINVAFKKQQQTLFNCLNIFKVIKIDQDQRIIYVQYGIQDLLIKKENKERLTQIQQSILDNLQYCYQGKDMADVMSYAVQTRKQQNQLVEVLQKLAKQSKDQQQVLNYRQKLSNVYLKAGKIQQAQAQAKEIIQKLSNSQFFNIENINQTQTSVSNNQLEKIDYIVNQTIYSSKNIVTIDKYDLAQSVLQQLSDKIQNLELPHLFACKIKIQLQVAKTNIQKGQKKAVRQILDNNIIKQIQNKISYFSQKYAQIQKQSKSDTISRDQIQKFKKEYDSELNDCILWKFGQIQNIYLQSIRLRLQIHDSNQIKQDIKITAEKYKNLLQNGLKQKFKTFKISQSKYTRPSLIEESEKVIHQIFLSKYQDLAEQQPMTMSQTRLPKQEPIKKTQQKPMKKLQQTLKKLNEQRNSLRQKLKNENKQNKVKQIEGKQSNVVRQMERIHQFSCKFFSDQYEDLLQGNLSIKKQADLKKVSHQQLKQSQKSCKIKIKEAIKFYQDQNIESYHPKLIGLKVLQNQISMKSPQQNISKKQQQISKCISNIQQLLCIKNRDKPEILSRQKYIKYLWQHTEGAKAYYNLSKGYKLKGQYIKALKKCQEAQKICNKALVQKIVFSKSGSEKQQIQKLRKQLKQKMKINPLFLKIKLLKAKIYRKLKNIQKHKTQISNLEIYFTTYNEDIHKSSFEADIKEQKILNLISKIKTQNQQENIQQYKKKFQKCIQITNKMITQRQKYLGTNNFRNGVSYCKIIICLFNSKVHKIPQIQDFINECKDQAKKIFSRFNQNPQKWRFLKLMYDYQVKRRSWYDLTKLKMQVQEHFCTGHIVRLQVLLQEQKFKQKDNALCVQNWEKEQIIPQILVYLNNQTKPQDFRQQYNEKIPIYKQLARIKSERIKKIQDEIKKIKKLRNQQLLDKVDYQKLDKYREKEQQMQKQKELCQKIENIIQEKSNQLLNQSTMLLQNQSSILQFNQNSSIILNSRRL